jgi:FSR family fosmidomycin resistance protein-like MFS transporter
MTENTASAKSSAKSFDLKGRLRASGTKVGLISLAHGVNDMYAGFLPTFVPFIRENLGLSYALAGSFNLIVGLFHIICQPAIGYMCDRLRRPFPMMLGPILCGLGAVMVPNAGSYAGAVFFAGLWGFGSALYHPQGTGGIGYVSAPERLGQSLTWYNMAGTLGSAFSPFIAVAVVRAWGYRWLPVTLAPTLALAALIYFSMPFLRDKQPLEEEKRRGFFKTIFSLFALLYPIWGLAVIRDTIFQCVRFFLPMKIAAQGGELESVGMVVFCLSLGSSLAMIPMERIARRWGGKRALSGAMLAGSGILLAAVFAGGMSAIVLYIIGISCIFSTLSLTTSMAQVLAPSERSSASTIVLGLAWGFGNILVSPIGKFADLFGIDATFVLLALLPVLGMPLFLTRPFKMLKS